MGGFPELAVLYGSAALLLAAPLLAALVRERRRGLRMARALELSRGRERELVRLVRLTASELRTPALSLLGHAPHVPPPLSASLIALCRQLMDTAEALLDHTEEPAIERRLLEEDVALGPLLDFVVAQVTAGLGPGRRAWRVAPALDQMVLRADRRALHQILLRVLTGAALATADGDSIEVTAQETVDQAWTLRIEDEGTGMAVPRVAAAGIETRGLGVGLALARSLMRAHGGSLAMESTALVGTRTLLMFPRDRVVRGLQPLPA